MLGSVLLVAGVVMLVGPGPGWLTIFLGLSILAAEFVWARRLQQRLKRSAIEVTGAILKRASPEADKTTAPDSGTQNRAD